MRINTFLAHYGGVSRRQADRNIESGRVRVNGVEASLGQQIQMAADIVEMQKPDGSWFEVSTGDNRLVYLAINKPKGYISSTKDEWGRPTVLDLIPRYRMRLFPVGRLDLDSEGLLLLTNDGELTQQLTHPRQKIAKRYLVWVRGEVPLTTLRKMEAGVKLLDGKTAPCEITFGSYTKGLTHVEMLLREGRNRQIRRMFKHFNFEVTRLQRVAIGRLELANLQGSRWMELSRETIKQLFTKTS